MSLLRILTAISFLLFFVDGSHAQEPVASVQWLTDAGLGVFTHFLPGNDNFSLVEKFDAKALAVQFEEIGAKYFVFTIYQNSGYFNAPNARFDEVTGFAPGERTSERDLPLELAKELGPRGIRLILYVTAQTPNRDAKAQAAFGLPPAPKDLPIDTEFAHKWAKVFEEWSLRYGTQVSGWWVDGSYAWVGFNEEIASIYSAALKTGNPNAVVAFNPGVKKPEWKTSDYAAGEINLPFEMDLTLPVEKAPHPQILTFLGDRWGAGNCRFSDEEWIVWAKQMAARGTAMTLDAAPNMSPSAAEPIGTLNESQMKQLQAIRAAIFP